MTEVQKLDHEREFGCREGKKTGGGKVEKTLRQSRNA